MRARGLKLNEREVMVNKTLSRPMRARGLKQLLLSDRHQLIVVAPHAGAWVETAV